MATIASVSVAVTWVGDDDQGLLENGRFFSTKVANRIFRKLPTKGIATRHACFSSGTTAGLGAAVQARAASRLHDPSVAPLPLSERHVLSAMGP